MKGTTCPTCQGEGKLISEYSTPPFMTCGDCGGTGSIVGEPKGAGNDYPVMTKSAGPPQLTDEQKNWMMGGAYPKDYPSNELKELKERFYSSNRELAAKDKEIAELKGVIKVQQDVITNTLAKIVSDTVELKNQAMNRPFAYPKISELPKEI